jgi:glycosyltransferase involved in cell wall biosynthesis
MTENNEQTTQAGATVAGERKKTILLLKPFVPYPLDCGSNILTHNLLRMLGAEFDVTLLTRKPESETEAREALESICKHVIFCEPPNLKSRINHIGYAISMRAKALFGRKPVAALYAELAFSAPLRKLLAEASYDLVQIDYWNLAGLGNLCPKDAKRCIMLHDVQPLVFEREAALVSSWFKRWQLKRIARAATAFEKQALRNYANVLTVTENDAEIYRKTIPGCSTVQCVPTLFEVSSVPVASEPLGSKLLFVGALAHRPNKDAVEYFVKDVLPLIRLSVPDVELVVVGRDVPSSIRKLESDCVRITGPVPEVEPYLRDAAVYVAPLRFGSGIKLKILEALSHGKAVVTTPIGAEGIEMVHGKNCLIAERPDDFAASVVRLLRDKELRHNLSAAGRRMIEERHSLEIAGPRVRELYSEMMKGTPPCQDTPVVAYLHHRFPSLTATFVYREVRAVGEAGIKVLNLACKQPVDSEVHAEARDMIDGTAVMPSLANPILYMGAFTSFIRRPIRFVQAAWRILLASHGHRRRWARTKSCVEIIRGGYLARMLRNVERVDHLHAPFSTEVATIGWMATQLTDIPFSFTSHTAYDTKMLQEKLDAAAFAVAISSFDKERLVGMDSASRPARVEVIHCGVSLTPPIPQAEHRPEPVVLSVGSLIEKKGHPYLIRACRLLQERGCHFSCKIVGRGPMMDALREEIARCGVEDCVELLGSCDQERIRSLCADATVFALPSIYAANGDLDGIPVVLMEAMASGVPCVSTHVSGIPELISSPEEGILVEEKDAEALADAIEKLLGDEGLREKIARTAREKIEREFDIHKSSARLVELFRESVMSQMILPVPSPQSEKAQGETT